MMRGFEQKLQKQRGWRAAKVAAGFVLAAWMLGAPTPAKAQGASASPAAAEEGGATGALKPVSEENMAWRATEVPVEDLAPAKPLPSAKPLAAKPLSPAKPLAPPPKQSFQAKDNVKNGVKATKSAKPLAGEDARLPQEFRQSAAQAPAGGRGSAATPAPASGEDLAKKAAEPMSPDEKQVHQYCINISSAAADARFAWEKKSMEEIAKDIDDRIAKLEEKTEEYKKWLARRDDFSSKAQLELVNIYSKMKPDAAAAQMDGMDEELAAALLLKLKPTNSSSILNEMKPAKGARLTTILAMAAKAQQGGKRPEPQPAGPKSPVQPAGNNPAPQDEKKL